MDTNSLAVDQARQRVEKMRARLLRLGDDELDLIFREARTHNAWQTRPVPNDLLRSVAELASMGPTSVNSLPARFVFITTPESKRRLKPHVGKQNAQKTMDAPVTAIIAYDRTFYRSMPTTFPQALHFSDHFKNDANLAQITAFRNGSLQGGYFIIAARALGLDCGPMSGFNNDSLDQEFFPDGDTKSNFLCNIGYGDLSGVFPRNNRLPFEDFCEIL